MKRLFSILVIIALCYFCLPETAQGRGNDFSQQAQESLRKKEYIRARYLFLQAYEAYA